MKFEKPPEIESLLANIDRFIESELKPLEDEHIEYFDHRREYTRTNWEDGTPDEGWQEILEEIRDRADEAGFYRMALPKELGGKNADILTITFALEHLSQKGPGIHNIIHTGIATETIIGDWRHTRALYNHGTEEQKEEYLGNLVSRDMSMCLGMTEPNHGSDPSYMETVAEKQGDSWVINGAKRFIGGMHKADLIRLIARTSGEKGSPGGLTAFLVPTDAEGLSVPYFHWTMNMPSTQAEIELNDVRVPHEAILGEEGKGLQQQGREFLLEGWLSQAIRSLGVAQFCIDECVEYANSRETFGEPLSGRQGIQFPVAELHTEAEMIRNLIYKTAWLIREEKDLDKASELASMVNYRANILGCNAADQAIQIHGGKGWTRHYPFEYLYRQSRRYRITEGADEIQKRRVAGYLFGYI